MSKIFLQIATLEITKSPAKSDQKAVRSEHQLRHEKLALDWSKDPMLCYVPYCVSGVPYFPVLVTCGIQEEQGGIVDCIQTINMSGINELLVSQRQSSAGALMSDKKHHYHLESLHELEELLDFPPKMLNEVELNSRVQSLYMVIRNARDRFSIGRFGEESQEENQENNPFQELHVQLQKATDRFHARIAAVDEGNNKTHICGCRRFLIRTTKSNSKKHHDINAYQELRDSMRMARRHFIPLIDQYISSRGSKNDIHKNNNVTLGLRGEERKGSRGYWHEPTTTSSSSGANATNCKSTIHRGGVVMEKVDHYPKPGSLSIEGHTNVMSPRAAEAETRSVQKRSTNSAANRCSTTLAFSLKDAYFESCLPPTICNCNKMGSGAAVTTLIMTTNSNQQIAASGASSPGEGWADGLKSLHPIVTNSTAELDVAEKYERLSSTGKDLRHTHWPLPPKSDGMSPLFRETEKNDGTLAVVL